MKTALEYPGSLGAIVANTYRNLRDFIVPMLTQELWDRMGQRDGWREIVDTFNQQSLTAKLKNGSYIYLRSCDRPDDLRGPNLSWFYIDEASKVPHKVWRIMVGRARVKPEHGWITTTPRGRNWVWEEWARKKRKNYEYFIGSTLDNPHLSKEYKDSLIQSYSGSFLRQEVYGEFVSWEGLVYNFEQDKHHQPAPQKQDYSYAIAGVDWGWVDPTAIEVAVARSDDRLQLVDEFYQKKATIEQICEVAQDLKEKWGIRTFYCDSARPEYIQELRNVGLDARKGRKELDAGIAVTSNYIDKGLLTVDYNACPMLIEEADTYHYEEDDMGNILKDRPIDASNHAMDALRYMVYTHSRRGYVGSRRGYR